PTTPPASPGATPATPAAGGSISLSTTSDQNRATPEQPRGAPQDSPPTDGEDAPPPIRLEPAICDFGFVEPSATPTKKIKIINTSTEPVLILAVQPSCKCTTINDIAGSEIPAGGSVELEASMTAQSSPGGKKAEIKLLFDGFARVVNLQMVMEVTLPVRMQPGSINAVAGQPQQGRLFVESLDKSPFLITGVHGREPKFAGFDPKIDAPRNQYLLEWDVTQWTEGEMPLFLLVETTHPLCPIVDVRLRHQYTFPKPVLRMQDYRLTTGRMESGQSAEINFEIGELPADEPVVSIASSSGSSLPGLKIEILETTKEGTITKIKTRVTPPKDFVGIMYAPITVYTTRRQQEMFIWGMIVPEGFKGPLGHAMVSAGGCSMRWIGGDKDSGSKAAEAPAAGSAPVGAAPLKPPTTTPISSGNSSGTPSGNTPAAPAALR
ncbi:MAG: DUF1573 domain-containing protein, partial [Phycisphaerae bacterium]|nr:DUF1573 domain-containing protein [Phycisphaerae bacterium]